MLAESKGHVRYSTCRMSVAQVLPMHAADLLALPCSPNSEEHLPNRLAFVFSARCRSATYS
jgi:hypothetical protein